MADTSTVSFTSGLFCLSSVWVLYDHLEERQWDQSYTCSALSGTPRTISALAASHCSPGRLRSPSLSELPCL